MAPVDGYLLRLEHEGCKNQALLRVISSPHSRLDPFFFFFISLFDVFFLPDCWVLCEWMLHRATWTFEPSNEVNWPCYVFWIQRWEVTEQKYFFIALKESLQVSVLYLSHKMDFNKSVRVYTGAGNPWKCLNFNVKVKRILCFVIKYLKFHFPHSDMPARDFRHHCPKSISDFTQVKKLTQYFLLVLEQRR